MRVLLELRLLKILSLFLVQYFITNELIHFEQTYLLKSHVK